MSHSPVIGLDHAPNEDKMRAAGLRPKQSPVLATGPRREQAKDEALTEPDRRATELVGIHILHHQGRYVLRQPPLQPDVLKVRRLRVTPILVEWRIFPN